MSGSISNSHLSTLSSGGTNSISSAQFIRAANTGNNIVNPLLLSYNQTNPNNLNNNNTTANNDLLLALQYQQQAAQQQHQVAAVQAYLYQQQAAANLLQQQHNAQVAAAVLAAANNSNNKSIMKEESSELDLLRRQLNETQRFLLLEKNRANENQEKYNHLLQKINTALSKVDLAIKNNSSNIISIQELKSILATILIAHTGEYEAALTPSQHSSPSQKKRKTAFTSSSPSMSEPLDSLPESSANSSDSEGADAVMGAESDEEIEMSDGDNNSSGGRGANNCKPCPLLENVRKTPLKMLFMNVQRQYTVSKKETQRMSKEEKEKLVPVHVRIMGSPQRDKLYFVAKDVCLLIHTRKGNVAKSIGQFDAAEKVRMHVVCPRSNGTVSTHVLTALTVAGVKRLLTTSRSPLAPLVLQWINKQIEMICDGNNENNVSNNRNSSTPQQSTAHLQINITEEQQSSASNTGSATDFIFKKPLSKPVSVVSSPSSHSQTPMNLLLPQRQQNKTLRFPLNSGSTGASSQQTPLNLSIISTTEASTTGSSASTPVHLLKNLSLSDFSNTSGTHSPLAKPDDSKIKIEQLETEQSSANSIKPPQLFPSHHRRRSSIGENAADITAKLMAIATKQAEEDSSTGSTVSSPSAINYSASNSINNAAAAAAAAGIPIAKPKPVLGSSSVLTSLSNSAFSNVSAGKNLQQNYSTGSTASNSTELSSLLEAINNSSQS
jgi:hypothetical protein